MRSKNSIRILQPPPKRTHPKRIWLLLILLFIIGVCIVGFFIFTQPTKTPPPEYHSLDTATSVELAPSKMANKIANDENYFKMPNKPEEEPSALTEPNLAPPLLTELVITENSPMAAQIKIPPSTSSPNHVIKKEKTTAQFSHTYTIDDLNAFILLELDMPLKEDENLP